MVTATAHPVNASGLPAKLIPLAVTATAVTLVVGYVGSQLHNSRNIMDSRFAQYNNSQSEAQRARTFEGRTSLDPRRSMFNILGH